MQYRSRKSKLKRYRSVQQHYYQKTYYEARRRSNRVVATLVLLHVYSQYTAPIGARLVI